MTQENPNKKCCWCGKWGKPECPYKNNPPQKNSCDEWVDEEQEEKNAGEEKKS
jgi:hypothetical protein